MHRNYFILIWALFFPLAVAAQLEVMSYNVRFANETDGENSWSLRKDFITDQIKFYKPDVIGVQEAVHEQMEYFKGNIVGYEYVGVARDDGGTKGEYSGIFYDTSRLEVEQEDTFWLSDTPEKPSKGWDAALPRVCTYALFKDADTGNRFWVFNTHFDHVGVEAREESARLIVSKIKKLNAEDLPVILMGDLNLEPEAPGVVFLAEEMEDTKLVSQLVFGPEGTFNAYNFDEPVTRRIDYIFTSKGDFEVQKYAVLSDSKDLKYPSDHLPVYVELDFQK